MPAKKTAAAAKAAKTAPTRKPAAKPAPKVVTKASSKPASKALSKQAAKTNGAATPKVAPKTEAKPAAKATAVKPALKAPAAPPPMVAPATKAAPAKPTTKPTGAAPAKPAAKPAAKPDGIMARGVRVNPRPVAPPPSAEGEDGDESSLLTGPRNVQPYIVKRGEQYMNREQLEHFRLILNTWKRDLMEEVDRTVSHMKDEAANFPDPNDRATQEEEFSLELRTRDRERKLIRKIDEAIKRIEDGSYGYCLETGEEIGIKRLEARPVATLSLEAQERRERREKQYGDRDDRYR
jgi:DnaK suppressor protein